MATKNTLDRLTAVELFTLSIAQLIHEDTIKGKVQAGYCADQIVMSDTYFSVPDVQIQGINCQLTIEDSHVVWGTGAFVDTASLLLQAILAWSPANYYGGYQTD